MTTSHKHIEKPWQPKIDRDLELNPFVNPLDRAGQLENPPPLEDLQPEEVEAVQNCDVLPAKPAVPKA